MEDYDTSIDPLYLTLYKTEDDSTKGSKNPGSTLTDAEFVVEFYLDAKPSFTFFVVVFVGAPMAYISPLSLNPFEALFS